VLGIRPDISSPGGLAYTVAPQPTRSLRWCNGSLSFDTAGKVLVGWSSSSAAWGEEGEKYRATSGGGGGATSGLTAPLFSLTVDATDHPTGVGKIGLPASGGVRGGVFGVEFDAETVSVSANGALIWAHGEAVGRGAGGAIAAAPGLSFPEEPWSDGRFWVLLSQGHRVVLSLL
jgi:hypothetical protein